MFRELYIPGTIDFYAMSIFLFETLSRFELYVKQGYNTWQGRR
jgi:hypothetical protein